jgi:hypothetical protein
MITSAYAQKVQVGPVEADTGNAFLDTVIVIVVVLVLAAGLQLIRKMIR